MAVRREGFSLSPCQPAGLSLWLATSLGLIFGLAPAPVLAGRSGRSVGDHATSQAGSAQSSTTGPVIKYASVIGGVNATTSSADSAEAIAVDSSGNTYVAGLVLSSRFPVTPGTEAWSSAAASSTYPPGAFIMKLDPSGNLVYSGRLAGVAPYLLSNGAGMIRRYALSIVVDSTGSVYLAGAAAKGLPAISAAQPNFAGGAADAFVAKLDPTGARLLYCTYLGGSESDWADGIAVDAAGNAYVVGATASSNFPVTPGARQAALPGRVGLFLAKLDAVGAIRYSTYLGGGVWQEALGIAATPEGEVTIAGVTYSCDFPVTSGAYQTACRGGADAAGGDGFVLRLDLTGTIIRYSTYLGGSAGDSVTGLATDRSGNAYVVGKTFSTDFPTTGPPLNQTPSGAPPNFFVAKLNPSGSALLYSVRFGGANVNLSEYPLGIAADPSGNVVVAGSTEATLNKPEVFPVLNAFQPSPGNTPVPPTKCNIYSGEPGAFFLCRDGFVTKINADGTALLYSSYLGGYLDDLAKAVAIDPAGAAYVAGAWGSGGFLFPTTSLNDLLGSTTGAFVLKIADGPVPPNFTASSITNAASFVPGMAGGGLITIFGKGLTNASGITQAGTLPLPFELAGTSVAISGVRAPILAVADVNGLQQINVQAPYPPFSFVGDHPIVVVSNNGSTASVQASVINAQPGIFLVDAATPAIQHASDYALVTQANPAGKGEAIIVYATGLGDAAPRPPLGQPASANPLSVSVGTTSATIGGRPAEVLWSGLAPGFVGVNQVNVRVPLDAASGSLDLVLTVTVSGNSKSSNTVKLWVK